MKGAGAMISWVIAACLATPACGNRVGAPSSGAQYELHTSGRFAHEVQHAASRIALVRLDPARRSTGLPSPNNYRATLLVVR